MTEWRKEILHLCSATGITFAELASEMGVSAAKLRAAVKGKKASRRVEKKIMKFLNSGSLSELEGQCLAVRQTALLGYGSRRQLRRVRWISVAVIILGVASMAVEIAKELI